MMTSSNGKISALIALCVGNSPVTGGFPSQRQVMQSFDVFFVLRLNGWVNNRDAGDLRRQRAHHDVTVMWNVDLWAKPLMTQSNVCQNHLYHQNKMSCQTVRLFLNICFNYKAPIFHLHKYTSLKSMICNKWSPQINQSGCPQTIFFDMNHMLCNIFRGRIPSAWYLLPICFLSTTPIVM